MTGIKIGDDENYLITGANGFLGSHHAASLKRKGIVIAGRASGTESLEERNPKITCCSGLSTFRTS